jgi:hypothetical protein
MFSMAAFNLSEQWAVYVSADIAQEIQRRACLAGGDELSVVAHFVPSRAMAEFA